jgi:hypothetical protein
MRRERVHKRRFPQTAQFPAFVVFSLLVKFLTEVVLGISTGFHAQDLTGTSGRYKVGTVGAAKKSS